MRLPGIAFGPTFNLPVLRRMLSAHVLFLFALGCSAVSVASANPAAPITIATGTGLPSTVIFVAEELGYFAKEGLNVRIENCVAAFRCIASMLDGKAQFSSAGDLAIMFNSVERKDFVILATYSSSPSILKLITRKSAHISKAQDLVGKRVGIIGKSASHYFLDNFLLFEGVDPKRVEHVPLEVEDMPAALAGGTVDALSTFDSLISRQRAALGNDAFDIVVPSYNLSTHLVALRKTVTQSHADTVKLLRAMEKAVQFIASEPLKAKAILAKHSGMDRAAIDSLWAGSQFKLELDPSLLVTLNSAARWAKNENLISDTQFPDFSSFIYPEPLNTAKSKGAPK
ncbi:ABC transporter substrate-binding protein [Undibacterium sp.]|jgi:ABC-type nitrate/sulfonate/bicarbonate transport system substrate-binding protein|uniref:ABC transporter substrate-binding protein n=1 Tax=Undibacterium sp. TaxID=1914977 RepID=UPI002D0FBAA9|nr:ABC transporter substrate-binding protein [Undibacterium sp.]HTD02430.1 ABC transporter substrate-binding protein [Undibacterium sp.]